MKKKLSDHIPTCFDDYQHLRDLGISHEEIMESNYKVWPHNHQRDALDKAFKELDARRCKKRKKS